ncbi:hypothetical protein BH09MYX1_BH09MYX1_35870 [soil metagenome]
MRAVVLLLVAPVLGLCACSGDASPGEASGIWAFAAGGTHDVSLCELKRTDPATLRCDAPNTGARVGFATCGDLIADNTLTVERREAPISVAAGGAILTSSPVHVAGSMIAFGRIDGTNTQDVDGDLQAGTGWTTSAPVSVGGDAFVGIGFDAKNSASIAGTLHVPEGSDVNRVSAGSIVFGAVNVALPIDCASMPIVASIAASATTTRDPAAARAIPPLALSPVKAPTDVTMGCGTYVLSSIDVQNTLAIHIVGRTVLVVQGDVHVSAPMTIDLADGASLDLVIVGKLEVDNTLRIGNASAPNATWMGVGSSIRVASPMELSGTLFAPQAAAAFDNTFDVDGAVVVASARIAAPLVVHDGPALGHDGCVAAK